MDESSCFNWGASHIFWLGGYRAENPSIVDFGPAVVFEAAFNGEQGVGIDFRPAAPCSIQSKEYGMRPFNCGCDLYFWVKSVFRFRLRSDCRRFGRLQSGASGFSMGRSRGGFRRPANGGRRASGREQQRASWQTRHRTRSSAIRMPRWSKAGANALLAVKCWLENRRWADFLDWRACRVAAA